MAAVHIQCRHIWKSFTEVVERCLTELGAETGLSTEESPGLEIACSLSCGHNSKKPWRKLVCSDNPQKPILVSCCAPCNCREWQCCRDCHCNGHDAHDCALAGAETCHRHLGASALHFTFKRVGPAHGKVFGNDLLTHVLQTRSEILHPVTLNTTNCSVRLITYKIANDCLMPCLPAAPIRGHVKGWRQYAAIRSAGKSPS